VGNKKMRNRIYKLRTGHRGHHKTLDAIRENVIAPNCVICGLTLVRKQGAYALESVDHLLERKTCGMSKKEGVWVKSDCLKKYISGKGNPNYKGLMPQCLDCGVRIKGYSSVVNEIAKRCRVCFTIWAEKTDYFKNTKQAKYIANRMRNSKGHYPEALKPYKWKKGMPAHNKLFEFCQEKDCGRKHLSGGLCSMHYQRNRKLCTI
jgi:hypothetical protein